MRNPITEHDKDIMITVFIILVGVFGSILDYYNGEKDLMPRIPIFSFLDEKLEKNELYKPAMYKIYDRYITMNSIWFLFVIIGMMLFFITLFNIKSPILIYGIPTLLYSYIKLKIVDSKIELYEYLIK